MKLIYLNTKLPTLFKFIVFISFIELFFSFFFHLFGYWSFQIIPYIRLITLFATAFFFLKNTHININLFNVSIKNNSENLLSLLWLIFSIIGFFVGVINGNPILYLFTDLIYILFGYFLYRIFLTNLTLWTEISQGLSPQQEKSFTSIIVLMAIISFIFQTELPSFFVVFTLIQSLFFYNSKKHFLCLGCLTPFFFQLINSNRALLIVFLILLFFTYSQNKFTKKNIKNLLLIAFVICCFFLYFIDDILLFIIQNLTSNPILSVRLNQIVLIFNGKANWNSPSMLSLKQRLDEVNMVIEFWLSSPFKFLFGGGMGATIEGFAFKDAGVTGAAILGKSAVHNIHVLPFAFIFRYGFLGVLLFLILLNNLFKYFISILLSKNSIYKTMIIFQFSWILYSIPAASYLWTCPLFWITLAYISNGKKIFNS